MLPWSGKKVPATSWENIVACCEPCNRAKADRTPTEASMPLQRRPRAPSAAERLVMGLDRDKVPADWVDYLWPPPWK